ncbi:EB module [Popillia japonica]|uniref:EB module n=1 Tax=Popillia japonica TaxID=7064 RepID=A0AAW1NKE8_POPJA
MYFYFSILIIVFNTALSDTNLNKLENLIIPCTDDELCENDFPGSKCVKNICSCMSENGCLEKGVPFMVRKLGRPCKSNEDCLIDNSECILTENGGICACIKDTVASEDQKQCLPLLSELYFDCLEDAQCSKIPHSECITGVCKCKENMTIHLGSCYFKKELGDSCKTDEDCFTIHNSVCFNDKCVCQKNYVKGKFECLQAAVNLEDPCLEDIQCSWNLGYGTACSQNECRCSDGYNFKATVKRCVQHLSLLQNCTRDKDCYLNSQDEEFLQCSGHICRCREPYKEFEDDCINSVSSRIKLSSSIILTALLYYLRLF